MESLEKRKITLALSKGLKVVIDDYIKNHPWEKGTQQFIADKAGVARTTIADIMGSRLKNISLENACKISLALEGPHLPRMIIALAKKEFPNTADYASKSLGHDANYRPLKREHESFFNDPRYVELLWAAYSQTGIGKENAIHHYGMKNLETLLDHELIKEEKDTIKGRFASAGMRGKALYEQVGLAYGLCNPSYGKSRGGCRFMANSGSSQFIDKCKREIQDLFIRLQREVELPENRGDKHFFLGGLFGVHLDLEESDNNKGDHHEHY